ncbi:nucleoside recognition domain-containing protein, partial [Sutterella wadsworthensis]|uniref:nucleoside recognition domain-containing protein n=1 Tax=Sutterella wadsworthensis TaxID=40545 RepID=UPI003FF0927F
DRVVLNRWLGLPIFLFIMYVMFLFTQNLGGAFIDFFDILVGGVMVDGFSELLTNIGSPEWLTVFLANGIGGGLQTVSTFIPVVFFLFLFLALLEDSGYMARAAFVMDRLMRALGLPGKAFVPLLVGFGCGVPAVMATRTMDRASDRIITVLMVVVIMTVIAKHIIL